MVESLRDVGRWCGRALVVSSLLVAATARADELPAFPADPAHWINSGPLTASGLKGKGIVLWFFEEECPRCRARWPGLIESAKKFESQPVVFIAVNSGSSRSTIEDYVRQVKCPWPVLLDPARDFEKACGVKEISLQNIYQMKYVRPDGTLLTGNFSDMEETANKALVDAKWKLDPNDVPDSLKPTWIAIETGNYKGLAVSLKKSQVSGKPEAKEAAKKLMEIVQQELDDQVSAIKEAQASGNTWTAYQLCNQLSVRFAGFDLPKDIATLKKDLMKDAKVKAGQAALKSLDAARKLLSSGNPVLQKKAIASLEQVVTDFPDTDLSRLAQSLIDSATKPAEPRDDK
ncbi:MAG: TlpA disulfide reductase family protein [Planctomycetota bacterium]